MKLYHICSEEHAAAIMRSGFKKPRQENLMKSRKVAIKGTQGLEDVVSFTTHSASPWVQMVGVKLFISSATSTTDVRLVALEIDVDETLFVAHIISTAMIFLPFAGKSQLLCLGQGIEITVSRETINALIRAGKAKKVRVSGIKKNQKALKTAIANTKKDIRSGKYSQNNKRVTRALSAAHKQISF